jgi:DNA-binding protein HU-beta
MNKKTMVDVVARKMNISKKECMGIVDTVFAVVTDTLAAGEKVVISGFGTFWIKERAPRTGREPKGGVEVHIPARVVPYFKAGRGLKRVAVHSIE